MYDASCLTEREGRVPFSFNFKEFLHRFLDLFLDLIIGIVLGYFSYFFPNPSYIKLQNARGATTSFS